MVKQVLEGVKVADFGWVGVGPIIARYLAVHGAEVIRLESSTRTDPLRSSSPYKNNIPGVNRSPHFAHYNCNKYGITLNLNHPKGVEIAKRIVVWSDIVSEGFQPGTMERWGLGYEELRRIKPEIIMVSTSNYGQTGPYAQQRGTGAQTTAQAGFIQLIGWPDRIPTLPFGAYTDIVAPRFGVAAVIAALDYRRRTGKGQYLDLSQLEASLHFLAPLILGFTANGQVPNRVGNRCPYAAPHGAYPCRGKNRWCVIAIFTDEEWDSFGKVIGEPEWTNEPRFATLLGRKENEDELDRLLGEWTVNFTPEEVMVRMQAAGIGAGVVQSCEDLHQDPQLKHRHYFRELEHAEIGKHKYEAPSFALSKTPAELRMPAPCLGEHNYYACTKILGMSDEEFIELLGAGVLD